MSNSFRSRCYLDSSILTRKQLLDLGRYGEMTTLRVGSKTWVFLNSNRVVSEIISKRANATNERPDMPVASELISRGNRFVLHHTPRWTESRRMTHHLLNGSALKQYGKWQELESVQMLAGYLEQPEQWYRHHYRYSVSIMHRIVLGERMLKETPELDLLRRVTIEFLTSINANWVDFFPKLASLPTWLQFWRKRYERMGQFHHDNHYTWWNPVKRAIASGTAPPSFVRDVVLNPATKYSGDDEQAMYLALSTVSAGSDNPRMATNTLVMAAICYPGVFQLARKEIDTVCGSHAQRLPCLDDMARMPYMSALLKEVLRWRPVLQQVPQHASTQDIEWEGYLFPAGTEFIINSIAVSQDYPEAEDFKPERFLDGNECSILQGLWAFGGGRRVCVGYKLAQSELFVAFARLVYCFDYFAVSDISFANYQRTDHAVGWSHRKRTIKAQHFR